MIESYATFSKCKTYRYTLTRAWLVGVGTFVICMLNPSTADATFNDPTIRRCIGFAEREGRQRLLVVNMYALRSTDPNKLRTHLHPYGPENHRYLMNALHLCAREHVPLVCAWGAFSAHYDSLDIVATAKRMNVKTLCFGKTASGQPKHPLYIPAMQPLVPYP